MLICMTVFFYIHVMVYAGIVDPYVYAFCIYFICSCTISILTIISIYSC